MNILDIVNKKENKEELTYEEIKYAVDNYVSGNINDDDMTLRLKSIMKNDMTKEETYNLTKVMIESGDIIDLSRINGIKVDKHSTGGVGDKTTLVVLPIVAASGVKIAKMSGRSLGFTGGTIDKLESIKGFNVNLSEESYINQVNTIGLALTSQTGNLVPADKKIYALRDVTNTTESIPLIASSIMSKKIASGADKIVLDVKVGSGAFMKNKEDARKLSEVMIEIGKSFNKEVVAIITNMEYPLGNNVGNSLEVSEAIDTLSLKGDKRFTDLCLVISAYMISIGKNISIEDALDEAKENLTSKKALNKFYNFVKYQHGDINSLEYGKIKKEIKSDREGYLTNIDTMSIAKLVNSLGAGRINKTDEINHRVGFILNKKINDKVKENDILGYVVSDNEVLGDLNKIFTITDNNIDEVKMILDIVK